MGHDLMRFNGALIVICFLCSLLSATCRDYDFEPPRLLLEVAYQGNQAGENDGLQDLENVSAQ